MNNDGMNGILKPPVRACNETDLQNDPELDDKLCVERGGQFEFTLQFDELEEDLLSELLYKLQSSSTNYNFLIVAINRPGNFYVQFQGRMGHQKSIILCECVSGAFLESGVSFLPGALPALLHLGWKSPAPCFDDSGEEIPQNYCIEFPVTENADYVALAKLAQDTLVILGAQRPDMIFVNLNLESVHFEEIML